MEGSDWLEKFHQIIRSGTTRDAEIILPLKPADVSIDSIGPTCIGEISALDYLTSRKSNCPRDKEMIKFLVRSGANPLQRTSSQHSTPAGQAFYNHENDVIIVILDHIENLNTHLVFHRMYNALHLSASLLKKEVLEYCLRRKVNVEEPNLFGMTALSLGIKSKEIVRILLKNGANVNARMVNGFTPVHVDLTLNKKYDVLNMLLSSDPDLNARSSTGDTPLHVALKRNPNINLIKKLLRHGSLAFIPGNNGGNSLHVLLRYNPTHVSAPKVTEILIKYGACVNRTDVNGDTPLHLAVRRKVHKIVECLALRGADFSLKNKSQQLPLHDVQRYENETKLLTVIVRHITMEAHRKRTIIPKEYADMIESSPKMEQIKNKCQNEIERMGDMNIPNSGMTYLNLFVSERRAVAKFARFKNTKIPLQKFRAKLFNNYGRQLKDRINEGLHRGQLEEHALNYFDLVFKKKIPMYCLEQFLDYLSDYDLCKLRKCLSASNSNSPALDFLRSLTSPC